SLKWTQRQLYMSKNVFNKCRANPWNAFVRQKLMEENEERAVGDQLKHLVFIKAHSTQLVSSYLHLTVADKNRLRESVNTLRMSRVKVTCTNPKALQKDVNVTFKTMQTEHFALKVESWVVGDFGKQKAYNKNDLLNFHVDSAGTASQRLSLTKLVSLCRQHIQDGLGRLSHRQWPKKKVKMNYDNYKGKIVETYSVALVNFAGTIQNPGKLGHCENLINLYNLLFKGTYSWTKLTSDKLVECIAKNKECQAHGEKIYKAQFIGGLINGLFEYVVCRYNKQLSP
ncbi:hypothetical protein F4604DRAFT_1583728, partial [Suillus subluteus]